ncbi:MAG: acyl-CoA dehydrogenase family protein [Spirochaetes bacterium]|nr:acyl-CoA dehydrogenase family protein [Spirochaetota bacterium]
MSLPDRHNPYNFDEFLQWRKNANYYDDDPFFRQVLRRYTGKDFPVVDAEAKKIAPKVSYRWRDMADSAARPEERPYVLHYDGHHNRIDRIVRPVEVEIMEREIFSEALFARHSSKWIRPMKMFLIYQNGEACISCPITCTEGLVALLEQHADTPELRRILEHCRDGIDGEYAIGAQYLSEIQGGSDVPSNLLEAVPDGLHYRLYGTKFFCSATHADYAVVTAKPTGAEKVGLFVVPSWLPGNREREIRNGYTIDRIKWKMGTSELTTGELTFNGAVAYPVGPLERGLANVVSIVLTYSRITVGISAAAFMTRAVREAKQYSRMRSAFGLTIANFPMVTNQIEAMERTARRTTAGSFRLYRDFLETQGAEAGDDASRRRKFNTRELIMLQKITAAYDSTDVLRAAMSIFGGHGVMEDFSSLPRLYRDSAVNELWEGPRNVLLAQIHRDLQKASSWYPPANFVQEILKGSDKDTVARLAAELVEIVSHPSLFNPDATTREICARWDNLCGELTHAYQDAAAAEASDSIS